DTQNEAAQEVDHGWDDGQGDDVQGQAGAEHAGDGDPTAGEDDGVGRGGYRKHEGEGGDNGRGDHQEVRMDAELHAGFGKDGGDHQDGGDVRGHLRDRN